MSLVEITRSGMYAVVKQLVRVIGEGEYRLGGRPVSCIDIEVRLDGEVQNNAVEAFCNGDTGSIMRRTESGAMETVRGNVQIFVKERNRID